MNGEGGYHSNGRIIWGGILILLGVVYALDAFGVLSAGDILEFWPLILIGVGATKISQARISSQRTAGFILVAIGGVFLLRSFHLVWFRGKDLWPVVFLLVGGFLVWQALTRRHASATGMDGDKGPGERVLENAREGLAASRDGRDGRLELGSVLNEFAFMGGGDRVVRAQDFRGGDITAIMGGFGIDLRGAAIAGDSATITIFTLWGGVDLKVPEDWNVAVAGVPLLGVFTNSSHALRQGDPAAKTLVVKGVAIMGGVEVKN
jgi:predicted membrane protein